MKRKSHLDNFSTESLFLVLEQNQNDLLRLQVKALENKSKLLHDRIIQIKQTIAITENIIIERYDTTSLKAVIKLLQSSHKEIKKNIYKEIITLKIIDMDELVPIDLLKKTINELEIEQLMRIIKVKEHTIYGKLALNSYDEKCLEVDDEVYKELLVKIKQDRREC